VGIHGQRLRARTHPFCGPGMGKDNSRWMELAELAANEQDARKMIELVREINELLQEKQRRLNREQAAKQQVPRSA
jgi:hypothetical protein